MTVNLHRTLVLAAFLSFTLQSAPAQDLAPNPAKAQSDAPAGISAAPALTDPQEIIRRTAENDIANNQKERDYTYIQRGVQKKLNGKGEVASTETRTSEVMVLFGEHVERLIEKDDKPLSLKDAAKEEEKINKLIEERKNEDESHRRKRLEKYEKERDEQRAFVKEIPEAYNLTLLPDEIIDGREVYVITANPKPSYEPHTRDTKFLTKFRFHVWIDKAEFQWSRLDAEAVDTISLGLFLARLHKGSRLHLEQARINDEVWLPKFLNIKLDAKLLLMKSLNYDIDVAFRNYKKFRTETKITPAETAPSNP